MQKNGFFFQHSFRFFQSVRHFVDLVAVYNAEIREIKTFQQTNPCILSSASFYVFLRLHTQIRRFSQNSPCKLRCLRFPRLFFAPADRGKNIVHAAHRGRNRHAVIVQYDQNFRIQNLQRIQGFVNQPVVERAVTDESDYVEIFFFRSRAFAIPIAADTDVPACPVS